MTYGASVARFEGTEFCAIAAEGAAAGDMDELGVEILSREAAAAHIEEWRRLAADCLEPNGFLEPDFALAAARHLGRPRHFLFVWDAGRKLVGLCPLHLPGRFAPLARLRVATHEQAPLGTPLLDRLRAPQALAAIFAFCREHVPRAGGLMFPMLPQEGPTARLLIAQAAAENRPILHFAAHRRAVLTGDPEHDIERQLRPKRRRNLASARRHLRAKGAIGFRLLSEPAQLGPAVEEFLVLEAKGWKGRRGTALSKSPARANFARDFLASLAMEGKCRIARLDCAGLPIAMGIVLRSGARAFFWKIAYDEAFAAFSPGVLLTLELSRALLADRGISLTDSCAIADHPMIDHLWKERMAFADVFVAVVPDRKSFRAAAAFESLRRNLRVRLKAIVLRLRRVRAALSKRARTFDPDAHKN